MIRITGSLVDHHEIHAAMRLRYEGTIPRSCMPCKGQPH